MKVKRSEPMTEKEISLTKELNKHPQWIKDHREVTGVFRNFETQGGGLKFYYRKWKGDNIMMFEMEDGQEYTVPRMVADHLNNKCWYGQHEHASDISGKKVTRLAKKIHRFGFYNNKFSEDENDPVKPTPDLYMAEAV